MVIVFVILTTAQSQTIHVWNASYTGLRRKGALHR